MSGFQYFNHLVLILKTVITFRFLSSFGLHKVFFKFYYSKLCESTREDNLGRIDVITFSCFPFSHWVPHSFRGYYPKSRYAFLSRLNGVFPYTLKTYPGYYISGILRLHLSDLTTRKNNGTLLTWMNFLIKLVCDMTLSTSNDTTLLTHDHGHIVILMTCLSV